VVEIFFVGAWRSLEARLLWEQEVGGSNPLAPTIMISTSYTINTVSFLSALIALPHPMHRIHDQILNPLIRQQISEHEQSQ
jgi:hypothetical protein